MDNTASPPLDALVASGLLGLPTPLQSVSQALDEYFAQDQTRTRAALMNFAIFSDDPSLLPELDRQLQSITRDHACRGLLVATGTREVPDRAAAWIKGQCHLDGTGGKFRCSEQISLLIQGQSEGFLTNLIFSNLRSDLPLVVWWQAALRPHFQVRLYSRIDRLILDSSQWADPLGEFALIREALQAGSAQFRNAQRSQLLLHDLAYTRGHEQRRAIAHLFDDPLAQRHVPLLNKAEIVYRPGHRHAALYIGAWLAHQLGALSPRPLPGGSFQFSRDSAPFTLHLTGRKSATTPVISAISLSSPEADFSVEPSPTGHHLLARSIQGILRREHLLPTQPEPGESLVSDILMRSGSNLLLAKVLPGFLALLELSLPPSERVLAPFS